MSSSLKLACLRKTGNNVFYLDFKSPSQAPVEREKGSQQTRQGIRIISLDSEGPVKLGLLWTLQCKGALAS